MHHQQQGADFDSGMWNALRNDKGRGRRKAWDVTSTVIRMLEVRRTCLSSPPIAAL
jgi:hypothetical protein